MTSDPGYCYLARVIRHTEPELIMLQLIADTDIVDLQENDEFVTVTLITDPFKGRVNVNSDNEPSEN